MEAARAAAATTSAATKAREAAELSVENRRLQARVEAQVGREVKCLSEEVEAARAALAEESWLQKAMAQARLGAENMLYRQSLAAQVGRDQKQLGEDVEAARREAAAKSADSKAREAVELSAKNRLLRARLNGWQTDVDREAEAEEVEDIHTVRKAAAVDAAESWTVSAGTRALWGMLVGSNGGGEAEAEAEGEVSVRADEEAVVHKAEDSSAVGVALRKKRKAAVREYVCRSLVQGCRPSLPVLSYGNTNRLWELESNRCQDPWALGTYWIRSHIRHAHIPESETLRVFTRAELHSHARSSEKTIPTPRVSESG